MDNKNATVTIPKWLMNNTNIDTDKFEKLVKESAGKFDDEVKGLIEVIKGFYEEALKRAEKTVAVRQFNSYEGRGDKIIRTIGLEEVREMLLPEVKKELELKYSSKIDELTEKNEYLENRIKQINKDLIELESQKESYLNKKVAEIKADYDKSLTELETRKLFELAKAKEDVKDEIVKHRLKIREIENDYEALESELHIERTKNRKLQKLLQELNPAKEEVAEDPGFFKRVWNKLTGRQEVSIEYEDEDKQKYGWF